MWLWNDWPKAIYLNIKAKGIKDVTEAPVIENYKTKEHDGKFYWDLVGIAIRPESDRNLYETIQMEFIDDKNERYIVSTTFTNIATSIINSFVWWIERKQKFKKVCLSLYKKGEYPSVWVFADGDMMSRHYEIKTLLAMTKKVKVNWKEVTDREELNEFLRWEITRIDEYLKWLSSDTWIDELESEEEFSWEKMEKEAAAKADKEFAKEENVPVRNNSDLPF